MPPQPLPSMWSPSAISWQNPQGPEGVGLCQQAASHKRTSLMSWRLTHALYEVPKLKETKLPSQRQPGPGGETWQGSGVR